MEQIIAPVDISLILPELTLEHKLGGTALGGNELYVIDAHSAPNTLREIGRLRELSYRDAGASSGKSMDLDEYDTMEEPYQQLIVWDPTEQKIIGGYRYLLGQNVKLRPDGQPLFTSSHLYHFSDEFIKDYLPHVMELGRSFVTPEYQSSRAGAKSIYAMDNLWEGIAAVILQHPRTLYFFGKMTIYPSYNSTARSLILHFLSKHFPDPDQLVRPYNELPVRDNPELMDIILRESDLRKDYRLLKDAVRHLGTKIPPLINSYINASPTTKIFGSCINDELSNTIETGIMICFDDIYADKRERHTQAFINNNIDRLSIRFPRITKALETRMGEHMMRKRRRALASFERTIGEKHRSPIDLM